MKVYGFYRCKITAFNIIVYGLNNCTNVAVIYGMATHSKDVVSMPSWVQFRTENFSPENCLDGDHGRPQRPRKWWPRRPRGFLTPAAAEKRNTRS